MPQHGSQPAVGGRALGCGQRAGGQQAQHNEQACAGDEQHRGCGEHTEQPADPRTGLRLRFGHLGGSDKAVNMGLTVQVLPNDGHLLKRVHRARAG